MKRHLQLTAMPERFAVVRLEAGSSRPGWVPLEGFVSITWATDETTIVCPENAVPQGIATVSRGWRGLKVEGPLAFSEVGVLASLVQPLALANISIFVLSTYDTDYLLVQEDELEKAAAVLRGAGYGVHS
jgi:hypothetical protein